MGRLRRDFDTAFWSYVRKTSTCWIWTGGQSSKRYGSFRNILVHRYAYEYHKGKIPDGMTIDHVCKQRLCVNPCHLEVVTRWENVRRGNTITGNNERKLCCVNGHEFTEANIYRPKRGGRSCRTCQQKREREYKMRLKERTAFSKARKR